MLAVHLIKNVYLRVQILDILLHYNNTPCTYLDSSSKRSKFLNVDVFQEIGIDYDRRPDCESSCLVEDYAVYLLRKWSLVKNSK